jgi:uncharacterized protein YmfQ (DUF2313 family)
MDAAAYAEQLIALLPPGRFWSRGGVVDACLEAVGEELARVEFRAHEGFRETRPDRASEMLAEWEEKYALPSTGTSAERVARLVSKVVEKNRTRPIDYQEKFATILGLAPSDVEVIETSRAQALAMNDARTIYRFFLYRDPNLAGSYSIEDAQALLDDFVQSHTKGIVIESKCFRVDDLHSLTDRDPIGDCVDVPTSTVALAFDGDVDHVSFGSPAALDVIDYDTVWTVAVWLKSTDAGTQKIYNRDSNATGQGTIALQMKSGGQLEIYLEQRSNGNDFRMTTSDPSGWNDGAWHHVIFKKTAASVSASDFEVFVDGVSQPLTNTDSDSIAGTCFAAATPTIVGAKFTTGDSEFFGQMRGLFVAASETSSGDDAALYNGGVYQDPDLISLAATPLLSARMNNPLETVTVEDRSGNGLNGVVGGNPQYSTV